MKKVLLFDLDGTLCLSRKDIPERLVKILSQHNKYAEIGIVTGSDIDFVKEQCDGLFKGLPHTNKVYAFACNGTKAFKIRKGEHDVLYDLISQEDIREKLGEDKFNKLFQKMIQLQNVVCKLDIPLTGNFITCRDSTINWCPIGRGANDDDRAKFKKLDTETDLRKIFLKKLTRFIKRHDIGVEACLSGDTSFDIYPPEWDKTYVLPYFKDYDIMFWGDRCMPTGNDYTMSLALEDRCIWVKDPEETYRSLEYHLASNSHTT